MAEEGTDQEAEGLLSAGGRGKGRATRATALPASRKSRDRGGRGKRVSGPEVAYRAVTFAPELLQAPPPHIQVRVAQGI